MIFKLDKNNCKEIHDNLRVTSQIVDYEVRDETLFIKVKVRINDSVSQIIESKVDRKFYFSMVDFTLSGNEQILDLFESFDRLDLVSEETYHICKRLMMFITLLHNKRNNRPTKVMIFSCTKEEIEQLDSLYCYYLEGPLKSNYRFLDRGRVQLLVRLN